jgi:hypothetical protein
MLYSYVYALVLWPTIDPGPLSWARHLCHRPPGTARYLFASQMNPQEHADESLRIIAGLKAKEQS